KDHPHLSLYHWGTRGVRHSMKPPKRFRLSAEQIRPLTPGRGGCFATHKITVDGERVGYMYREAPDFGSDSGWRFFSGSESQEYVDAPDNTAIYEVNTIANYDPEIISFLDAPVGSAFARDPETGELVPDEPPESEN